MSEKSWQKWGVQKRDKNGGSPYKGVSIEGGVSPSATCEWEFKIFLCHSSVTLPSYKIVLIKNRDCDILRTKLRQKIMFYFSHISYIVFIISPSTSEFVSNYMNIMWQGKILIYLQDRRVR